MAINPSSQWPTYCKNCIHRFVCGIQDTIREQDADVKKFNTDNVSTQQSVSSINYTCRYKGIDPTI
jgi:hypothetical protein